ncbi:hypothetical protein [Pontixanthobacter sp.]|uniref:hypothetical protein n=1 Tax=Pontixanthobacter sp. TaxID=2792078 RepID=UPI003C79C8D8
MDIFKIRNAARISMGMGCLAVLAGGALMAFGVITFGDVIMVGGFISLIVGAAALSQTPTEDSDVS